MIRKSTNLLLTRTLSHCLQYAIKKKNVGLAEVLCLCVYVCVSLHTRLGGKQLIYYEQLKCGWLLRMFRVSGSATFTIFQPVTVLP